MDVIPFIKKNGYILLRLSGKDNIADCLIELVSNKSKREYVDNYYQLKITDVYIAFNFLADDAQKYLGNYVKAQFNADKYNIK